MVHGRGAGWDGGRAPYQDLLDIVAVQLPEHCSWGDSTHEIRFRSAGIRLVTLQSSFSLSSATSTSNDPRNSNREALGLIKRSVEEEERDQRSPAALLCLSEASRRDARLLAKLVVWGHQASIGARHHDALALLSLALRLDSDNADAWELLGVCTPSPCPKIPSASNPRPSFG